VFFKKT